MEVERSVAAQNEALFVWVCECVVDEVARRWCLVACVEGQIHWALCPDVVPNLLVRYWVAIEGDRTHYSCGVVVALNRG